MLLSEPLPLSITKLKAEKIEEFLCITVIFKSFYANKTRAHNLLLTLIICLPSHGELF